MRSRLSIAGCILLTAVVVHTSVRIEVLNARYGYYLPRTDFGGGNPKWRNAARTNLLTHLDRQIALKRLSAFIASHPNDPFPDVEQFTGPPYSENEQHLIDAELADNALRLELHSWVGGMGLLQYLLGPVALVWAAVLLFSHRSIFTRIASGTCLLCAAVSIGFMLHRGYLTSLGW